jgi:hypothetical protein
VIRVSPKAKRLLSTLWVPDGEVLRLIRPPESYGHAGQLAFRYGRGEGGDQIVQHGGKQVLRIDPAVRRGFDGSTVEAIDGAVGMVPPRPSPLQARNHVAPDAPIGKASLPIRDMAGIHAEPLTENIAENPPLEPQG